MAGGINISDPGLADRGWLLWVGKERATESFEKFFALIGAEIAAKVEFVCSDMWKPYLKLIAKHCPNALNILDRFDIVAKMNLALSRLFASGACDREHQRQRRYA